MRMFHPRSIAVIGASPETAKPSGQPLMHLRNLGYSGEVYPINPRYAEIQGWKCWPGVAELPVTPDLVMIAVAAANVPHQLQECGRKGVRHVIVISSGFSEMGDAGTQAQQEIAHIAQGFGMKLVGPNCQGMISVSEGLSLGFGSPFGVRYPRGEISMTSQSGAWGNTVMLLATQAGLGFCNYLSTGNEAVTTSLDLIDWYIDDPATGLLLSYVEGFQDARRLTGIGRRALAAGKPYLLWKVGTSDAGAKAAASHTANLGGSMALYRAAFRQSGIIEVNDVDEMIDRARALLSLRKPKGNRVAVVTLSGGAGVLMADHCVSSGLELPTLAPHTLDALRAMLPPFAGLNNPIDLTGNIGARQEAMIEALTLVVSDPNVDMMGVCLAAASGEFGIRLAQWVAQVANTTDKPILVSWIAADPSQTLAGFDALRHAGVPLYPTPVRCVYGMDALWRFERDRSRLASLADEPIVRIERPMQQEALRSLRHDLSEHEAKKVLADYGITVTAEELVQTPEEAVRAAQRIGYPVAVKIASADIPHKTEAGGVRIGIADEASLRQACLDIQANAAAHAPDAHIDGLLVQAMVGGGVEVILGTVDDPQFGPAIMFGLGGIHAEVLKDVSFRVLPITRSEARDMVHEIRAFAILDGARGKPRADVEALVDAIVRLAALTLDQHDHIGEIDINPLFVLPEGRGVVAGDALIRPLRRG